MRCWMNNLSSSDRYLHKAAQNTAKIVQDVVKDNPRIGFALLSNIVGKSGRPDFDKVTRTKTVEGIMGSLSNEGVMEYVEYLQNVIVSPGDANGCVLIRTNMQCITLIISSNTIAVEERRQWAIDQLHALCRNASVPKEDNWISTVLDFLLVHGFFQIRKPSKKSGFVAVRDRLSQSSRRLYG